jgi:hypothetical protein
LVIPVTPKKGVQGHFAEAAHRRGHLALEGLPAHLAIGYYRKTGRFLQRNGLINGSVFYLLKGILTNATRYKLSLRGKQLG